MKNNLLFLALLSPLLLSCSGQSRPAGETGPDWKTGVALYSFNRFPLAAALEKADSAGAEYVEGFDFHALGDGFADKTLPELSEAERAQVRELLRGNGLRMPSMYVGAAKTDSDWVAYFELGKQLDMEFFVCEPEKAHLDLLDSLAGEYGIGIAIHQHAKGESRYWHPDSVLAALEGRPNLGVCADLGHWVRSGLDPVEALAKLSGKVLSVHAKDLDESGNIQANDVRIGTGVIDYQAVIDELKRQQFTGLVYIECEHNWLDNLADVSAGMRYLDSLAAAR